MGRVDGDIRTDRQRTADRGSTFDRRRGSGAWTLATALLAVATVASTFGTWARSGSRSRDSYELVDVAARAGVLPDGLEDLAAVWFLVPALGGAVVVAASLARHRLALGAASSLALVVVVGAALVLRSPLDAGSAAAIGAVLGVATAATGAAGWVAARRES